MEIAQILLVIGLAELFLMSPAPITLSFGAIIARLRPALRLRPAVLVRLLVRLVRLVRLRLARLLAARHPLALAQVLARRQAHPPLAHPPLARLALEL